MMAADERLLDTFRESVRLLSEWSSGKALTAIISQIPDHVLVQEITR